MTSLDVARNSNGYSRRRFWQGCYSQSTSAFGNLSPASGVQGSIIWCPVTKKYYCGDISNTNSKVYSRTPGGLWTLVHTGSGNGVGLFWSRRLGMLVYFTTTHIYTSVDGTTWVSRTVPASYAATSMTCFCDANTYSAFIGIESGTSRPYLYKTTDGEVWVRTLIYGGASYFSRCGVISGSDTVVLAVENATTGLLAYTLNGTSFTLIVNLAAMYGYFPPTPLRQEHWYINADTAFRSVDGVSFSNASRPIRTGTFTAYSSLVFGGVMCNDISSVMMGLDFLNVADSTSRFSNVGGAIYTSDSQTAMISTQGEFLSQNTHNKGWVSRPVGTWLEPGDHMCILIGGGGQNVSTTVGGCAGAMARHKFTVTEKYRWIAYNIAGATAIVDVGGSDGLQADNFLAYASFPSYNAQPGPNQACFGDEVYYGMPANGQNGAACGPSGGNPAYRGLTSTSEGCATLANTTATTPNDWWDPEDWVGNPSGTGYPGTAGSSAATIGLLGASKGSGVFGSYGSGGCNTSTAFAQRGSDPIAIIYSN